MSATRPQAIPVEEHGIPPELKALPQWVVWRYVEEIDPKTGEVTWDKPPVCVRTGKLASSTNPETWCTFAEAIAAYRAGGLDGIGFCLHRNADDCEGLIGIDLDKCRDPQTGEIEEAYRSFLPLLRTYTEVSPSGCGLRLFVYGKLPATGRKRGRVECYETARYVTITGQHVQGTPQTIEHRQDALLRFHAQTWPAPAVSSGNTPSDASRAQAQLRTADDAEIVRLAMAAKNGEDFRALWNGDWSAYGSQSEADAGLCNHLAFWCAGDEQRIGDLFAQSGLFRSKWQREDYRKRTVAFALRGRTDFYTGPGVPLVEFGHTTIHANGTSTVPAASLPSTELWGQPIPLNAPPGVPPFPTDVFPAPLRAYAAEVAWAVNAPVDFVAVPMLVAAAGAIGNARWLTVTSSHKQPPVVFAAIIGRPGSGKSTPLDFVLAPLHIAEAEFYRKWEEEKREYDAATEKKDKEKPRLRRCLVDDTTVEALCRVLSENPRGVVMARDELAALVTGLNQYRDGGKGNDRQIFLKIWSAAPIKVDRSKLEGIPLTVRRPCLPIIGGIQPGVIDWLRGEQKDDRPPPDDGFFDRFVVSYPGDLPAIGEQWREVSPEALTDWHSTLAALLDLKQDVDESKDKRDLYPRGLPFTDEGRAAWARLTQEHADEVNDPSFPDWLRGPWQKLCPGYAGRLALVLQLLHWTCNEGSYDRVEGRSVEDSFRLVAYFKAHARKVYAIMAADPCTREAAHVLRWLMRSHDMKVFSRRDAHRQLAHTFPRSESLEAPLTRLVEHGYLRVLSSDQRNGPGRKASTRYEVNTLWERRKIDTIDEMNLWRVVIASFCQLCQFCGALWDADEETLAQPTTIEPRPADARPGRRLGRVYLPAM